MMPFTPHMTNAHTSPTRQRGRSVPRPIRSLPLLALRAGHVIRAFTLTELLVAMAIIVVIAGVTAVGIRTIARDAKLASATNTIIAALDTARGVAIRDNKFTVVAFRAVPDGYNQQFIEIVIAQWTGESPSFRVNFPGNASTQVMDRFRPVAGINVRRLPSSIKIAGAQFDGDLQHVWRVPSHFPAPDEAAGSIIGIMYSGQGTVVMANAATDSNRIYIDFSGDGLLQHPGLPGGEVDLSAKPTLSNDEYSSLWFHEVSEAEATISLAHFLAVFDDDVCRDQYDTSEWWHWENRQEDYKHYIDNNADRIHFNRYTGVVMR